MHGVPRCSVLEASWLYSEGAERLDELPRAPTVAAKVRVLIGATERLVAATAGRCDELSADDLVPLVSLALVASRSISASSSSCSRRCCPTRWPEGRRATACARCKWPRASCVSCSCPPPQARASGAAAQSTGVTLRCSRQTVI